MLVDDGVEGETIAPRCCEVSHVDVVVTSRLHLAPQQQGILGRSGGSSWTRLFDCDFLDLEPEDDGPDETQCEPGISVDDIVCTHVFQVDALLVQEGESLVHVFEAVNAHLALGRARLEEEN